MRRIGDADGEGFAVQDIVGGLMACGQVQAHNIVLDHGSPGGIHDIHASIIVIGRDEQHRHGENAGFCLQRLSHFFSFLPVNGTVFFIITPPDPALF